ncbi:MAG: hypothetical protein HY517_02565 [Candidatus Aenigmarchaeota archaeon]|nr:hypothetical protein [Candidatus Aenigmarchaeota archaeon]
MRVPEIIGRMFRADDAGDRSAYLRLCDEYIDLVNRRDQAYSETCRLMKHPNAIVRHEAIYTVTEGAADFRRCATDADIERISHYTRRNITALERSGKERYHETLIDAALVLHHHPNQIVRHEAAFVLGDFPYRSESDKFCAVRHLITAFKRDPSVVAQHESVEAAGEVFCAASMGAAAHMAKIIAFKLDHPDVVKTAEESLDNIMAYMQSRPGRDNVLRELSAWRNYDDATGEVGRELLHLRGLQRTLRFAE